jgi:2-keto-4-pentenoate hydratase/2-oxohepta-3-ene-1,7-dioic acid hydratase in catechol pathway
MRLVTYARDGGEPRPGILVGDRVADARELATAAGWPESEAAALTSNRRVVGLAPERLRELGDLAEGAESAIPLVEVRLGPPIPDPEKIICLGLNYIEHAAESGGAKPPQSPMFFAKFANSLIGPEDPIVPPKVTEKVDYEAELAVVIGSPARGVSKAEALAHVAGAMAFNDVSARDLQLANPLWTGGKAIDTFAPCGPALVTLDELGDLTDLPIRTRVNGEGVQAGNSGEMVFGVAETIAFLSRIMTLVPGDVIATGTPPGVGASRTPQLFLKTGDLVEVEVEGIGRLANRIAEPA